MTFQSSASLSEFSSNGGQPKNFPTHIFKKLRKLTSEAEILQAAVEIVYQSLKCDRAVVYSMQSESLCKITAEAVTAGYAQTLGSTIKDPCFEARYIEKYQRGRVRAITNIHEAGMSPCYVENLAKIDVKSNLVVPLSAVDNSLYGLLVMHQCSRTRKWQQKEVEFILSVANWAMEKVAELRESSRLQQQIDSYEQAQHLIADIARDIHSAATVESVLQIAVEKAKTILNCDRVVVYGLQRNSVGEIVAEATIPALASILANVIEDPCFEYRYIDKYQQGRVRAIDNIYEAGMTSCYVDNLAKIGVKANLVAPINRDNGKIYGLLVAHHCFDFKNWQKHEIEYFKQIAFHTGLSLSKAKLKEQSLLVEHGLTELSQIENSIQRTRNKVQEMGIPLQNTSRIMVETNNLNKLLEREINTLDRDGSLQTKKNLKLIHIIVGKLAVISSKLQESLNHVSHTKDEVRAALDETIEGFK